MAVGGDRQAEKPCSEVQQHWLTHRSGFAIYFLLDFSHLGLFAVLQTFARRGRAHQMVVSVHAAVAAGPAVVHGLIQQREAD